MNKQEFIEQLEAKKNIATRRWMKADPASLNDSVWKAEKDTLEKVLTMARELQIHPPVEVEPCVADWLDGVGNEDNVHNNLALFYFLYRYSKKIIIDSDIDEWFNKSSEGIFILSDALRYGYVRKEEKYLLPVPYLENMYYAMYDDGKIGYANSPKELTRGKNQFTEEEIKEYFPDMADKKIPVDES